MTPATVHVFGCVFCILLYIYAGSQKLVLRSAGSSPLCLVLPNGSLVRFEVLRLRQSEVILVPLHLRPQTLLRQPSLALDARDFRLPLALDARDVCCGLLVNALDLRRCLVLIALDLRLVEMMDRHSGRASNRRHQAQDSHIHCNHLNCRNGAPFTARACPRVGCRERCPPQPASLPCWRVWMCLCVNTLVWSLVRTIKIETQT